MSGFVNLARNRVIKNRRSKSLCAHISIHLPQGSSVLDIGSGDGNLIKSLSELRPDLHIVASDPIPQKNPLLKIETYDGKALPLEENSFDVVTLVDVLHHDRDPAAILREAKRVSKSHIVIKDHLSESKYDQLRLTFMDYVGNFQTGIPLYYFYRNLQQWEELYRDCGLVADDVTRELGLYTKPFHYIFDDNLHHISMLKPI